jgi:hypothetical protein
MDFGDYNVAFTQCLTDLGDQIQEEQVKIEKWNSLGDSAGSY